MNIFSRPGSPAAGRLQPPKNGWLKCFLLCALAAALIFLPFQIVDGGFFHYAGDFNSQQISFYRYMNAFVKAGGTFSWETDLGSGAANAYSFYLYGSPFFWFSLLFPQSWLPYLMCPLLVLKFGVAGGGAYLWLKRYIKDDSWAVVAACMYGLSGFTLYNVFFNHFVDVVALFPYMLWALDECVYEEKRGLFAFWVAVNLLNNYFFFVGQVVFLVIYFICKLANDDWDLTLKLFIRLAVESVLGVGLGCVLAVPSFISLLDNPRSIDLSSGWGFLTYSKVQQYLAILLSWVLPPDSPYLPGIWSEGVIKWTSMSAYLPLCSVAGVAAYWKAKNGDCFKKILGTCVVFALVPVLNSAFYAFNSSYYARWYYMPLLVMALCSVQAFADRRIDLERPIRGVLWIMVATLAFAACPVLDKEKDTWTFGVLKNPGCYAAVLGFGLLGLAVFWIITRRWRNTVHFAPAMLACVLAFSCLFGITHIAIGKFGQWDTDSDLVDEDTRALLLKADLPEGDWRIDTFETHDNLGLWLEKSCVRYFGSTAAPSILHFYPDVGVTRDVRSDPDIGLYALRGLLSVQYTIMPEGETEKFEEKADDGWEYAFSSSGFALYRNKNYVPFGFTYDYYVTEEQFQGTIKTSRGNLLMRALCLSDEQIKQYRGLVVPLPSERLTALNYDTYTDDCADRRANACDRFAMTNTGFTASITLEKPELVFFSVPYDDGFAATVNGEEAEVLNVDGGLTAIVCPAGACEIECRYTAVGIREARMVAAISAVLLAVWVLAGRRVRARAGQQDKAEAGVQAETEKAAPKTEETTKKQENTEHHD